MSDAKPVLDEPTEPTLTLEWPRSSSSRWLLEFGGPIGTRTAWVEEGRELVVGSGRSADLRIEDRAVSARHARLRVGSQGLSVADLDSKNGVFVGGARVREAALGGANSTFVVGTTVVAARSEGAPADEVSADVRIPGLVGDSMPMREVARQIRRVAPLSRPVLIQGETGTGKDLVARALHAESRRSGIFVAVNAAQLETLADSELFGHCRGAFTGAMSNRAGVFEQAHQGTLFLDEVAELAPSVQSKLLRVVEDGQVRRVGATHPSPVDVRLVTATWAPLEDRAAAGRFRSDLFHRLSVFVVELPPLRQRTSDIPALVAALLRRYETEVGSKQLTASALARLVAHGWPGNVRELATVLYRAAVRAEGKTIREADLGLSGRTHFPLPRRHLDRAQARKLLDSVGGNVSAAARAARVPRSTFRGWLERR